MNNTKIEKNIEVVADAANESFTNALTLSGRAKKANIKAEGSLIESFIQAGYTLAHTLSPCKSDGITLNEDSKSALTIEEYKALNLAYATGLGFKALYLTNPKWIATQISKAKKAVALATEAVASAKTKKATQVAREALNAATASLASYNDKKTARSQLVRDCGGKLKDLRKSFLRAEFNAHVNYLVNEESKTTADAQIGAASYCEVLKQQSGVSVKTGNEKYLPESDELPTAEQVKDKIDTIKSTAIKQLEKLPDSPEVRSLISKLS